jgi:hypothetical protein
MFMWVPSYSSRVGAKLQIATVCRETVRGQKLSTARTEALSLPLIFDLRLVHHRSGRVLGSPTVTAPVYLVFGLNSVLKNVQQKLDPHGLIGVVLTGCSSYGIG